MNEYQAFKNIMNSLVTDEPLMPDSKAYAVSFIRRCFVDPESINELKKHKKDFLYETRDYHLWEAYQIIKEGFTKTPMQDLIQAIKDFKNLNWQIWKVTGLGENADELKVALYKAFSTGLSIPESRQQLSVIVSDKLVS